MYPTEDLQAFRVDFSNVGPTYGTVKGSLRNACQPRTPLNGDRVLLADYEGNSCYATKIGDVGTLYLFQIDAASWTTIRSEIEMTGVPSPIRVPGAS